MPVALTGGPAEGSAQLIAHLKSIGVVDASGDVAATRATVAISAQADSPASDNLAPRIASELLPEAMAMPSEVGAIVREYLDFVPGVAATPAFLSSLLECLTAGMGGR